jgi:hypothetical protein
MPYIIENANVFKENEVIKTSFLISENRIANVQSSFKKYLYMKMNAESFLMTPSYVLLDTRAPLYGSFESLKEYMINEFLLKGCTVLFTYVNVSSERELTDKLKMVKTALLSSPIDFLIGVRIPLRLISPSFIRKCKKEKIPAIFIELQDSHGLDNVPWGWIREALFPFNCPLIPIPIESKTKENKAILAYWTEVMQKEKISSINEVILENRPLETPILNKIGLLPKKACLKQGAELSYNLYLMDKEIMNIDVTQLFLYHSDRLVVTVHKGNVIRAGKDVLFKSGDGEFLKVKTPSFFSF